MKNHITSLNIGCSARFLHLIVLMLLSNALTCKLQVADLIHEVSGTNYFICRYDASKIGTAHFLKQIFRCKYSNNDKMTHHQRMEIPVLILFLANY